MAKKEILCDICEKVPVDKEGEWCKSCYDDACGGASRDDCPQCGGGGCLSCKPHWFIR